MKHNLSQIANNLDQHPECDYNIFVWNKDEFINNNQKEILTAEPQPFLLKTICSWNCKTADLTLSLLWATQLYRKVQQLQLLQQDVSLSEPQQKR